MREVVAVVLVVSVWIRPVASAQGVVSLPPPQVLTERATSDLGAVRGRVVTDDGQPVPNAMVRLMSGPSSQQIGMPYVPFSSTATSDADGRFAFTGVPAGSLSVLAEKSGFYNTFEGDDAAARAAMAQRMRTLAGGQTIDDLVVTLSRAGVITGKVLLPSGEPAERMFVEVLRKSRTPSGARWMPAGRGGPTTTDDTGAFRLFGLPPADYVVSVRPAMGTGFSGPAERDTRRDGVATTYFPGTTRLANATTVTVKGGAETGGLVLSLAPARLASIRGRVIAPAGVDPATVNVAVGEIVPERMGGSMSGQRVGADGTFTAARLAPGRYRLTTMEQTRGMTGTRLFASAIIDIDGADVDDVVLTMTPGATLTGRVVTTTGEAVPNPGALRVTYARSDMEMMTPPPLPVEVRADGTFRIEHVFTPGYLRLLPTGAPPAPAGGPQAWTLASVRASGRDVTDVPIDPARDGGDLTLVVTPRAPEVKGRVTGGADGQRRLVVVFPEDDARWTPQSVGVRWVGARPDGTFSLRSAPPGDRYLIVAVEGLEAFDIWNEGLLAALRPAATPIRLEDGGVHEVTLAAVPRPRP